MSGRVLLTNLLARLRRPRAEAGRAEIPRGLARSVIVVKPRDPRFKEVIYVLRDEALRAGDCDREELLRQAEEAARLETGKQLPPWPRFPFWPAAALLLGALAILALTGVL